MKLTHLSLSTKLLAGVGFVLLLLLSVDLWSLYRLQLIGNQLRLLKRGYLPLTKLASHMDAWQFNKKPDTKRLLSTSPRRWTRLLLQRLRYTGGLLKRSQLDLQRWVKQASPGNRSTWQKLQRTILRIEQHLHLYQSSLQKMEKYTQTRSQLGELQLQLRTFRQVDRLLRKEIRKLGREMDARLAQVVVQAERAERRSTQALVLLSVLAIFVSLVVFVLSRRSLARIPRLVEFTRRIAAGDYQLHLERKSKDEIGALAEAFNSMAHSLEERERNLEEAYRELQSSSERLMRSERLAAIGRLAAQITHEVRNPLNAIGLNLELLEEDTEQLPNATEALAVLHATMDEVERLTQITEEYLRFAALPPPRLEAADVNPLLSGTVEFLNGELNQRGIRWDVELEEPLPAINVDQRQLRQALLNLLRNAIQAASLNTEVGGELAISTRRVNDNVEIKICDNGPGISEADLQEIFDPFFSTKEEGSGLGLPLTQQIILGHGGTIVCESHKGRGTCFILAFPASETNI